MSKNTNKKEEYSVTGFSDLVASPAFLAVLVLTFILGISSVFGFFQNPRKLKAVIDYISKRVSVSEVSNSDPSRVVSNVFNNNVYPTIASGKFKTIYNRNGNITASTLDMDRYSILSEKFSLSEQTKTPSNSTMTLALDYNIVSKSFWRKLGMWSELVLDLNKTKRVNAKSVIVGSPISPYYSLDQDSLKYYLKTATSVSL